MIHQWKRRNGISFFPIALFLLALALKANSESILIFFDFMIYYLLFCFEAKTEFAPLTVSIVVEKTSLLVQICLYFYE